MADNSLPSNEQGGAPVVPSKARRSLKEQAERPSRRSRGRLKLKPAVDNEERFAAPPGKGPVKAVGYELQPRSQGRQKAKPTDFNTGETNQVSDRIDDHDAFPDQIAPRRRRGPRSAEESSRYVRFHVRVEAGKMSIVDSQVVDSALVMPPTIHGEYAYEITDGARLLHADTIPDLGVVRSFSDPHGTPEQLRHHTYRQSTYEFDVRVPEEELTQSNLSNIAVVLYRVKERAPTRALTTAAPLGTQFEREFREVTRISGIPDDVLPDSLRRTR
jgi:hypothetical protein